jgi:hypothetical protein
VLEFSRHARKRMAERGITEQEVIYALDHQSADRRPGDNGGTVVVGYAGDARVLKVVLGADGEVVTVMAVGED